MPLTFNEAAEAWVRKHYPEANPVATTVSFDTEYNGYATAAQPYIEVSWLEDRPVVTGFSVVNGRLKRSDGTTKPVQVCHDLGMDIDLTELIREITDLALEGTTDGAPRSELHQSERTE